MAILRRTPRAVYRVYSQDDYLAGADQLDSRDPSPVAGVSRERLLRRLAGAAVLTGAVGATAGVIVLAGIRERSTDRQVAVNRLPRSQAVPPPAASNSSIRADRPGAGPHDAAARRSAADRRKLIRRRRSPYAVPASLTRRKFASVRGSARNVLNETAGKPTAQSEFGFER
jgi:hypothetical protein